MELYGTANSPYTRIVRVLAAELGLEPELRPMAWRETPDALFALNPTGRVPVLVDGTRRVTDSRVICAYLAQHPQARPAPDLRLPGGSTRWDEEGLVTLAYGILDSGGVLRVFRDPPAVTHPYLERSGRRIGTSLAAIDQRCAGGHLVEAGTFGLAEIAVLTAVDAMAATGLAALEQYRQLQGVRERWRDRPSLAATAPRFG